VTILFIVLGYTLGVPIFQALVGGGLGSVRVAFDASLLATDDPLRGAAELLADAPQPLHPRLVFERGARKEAEARVLDGDLDALLRAAPTGRLEVVVSDGVPRWLPDLEGLLGTLAVPLRLAAEGVPEERVSAALEPVALDVTALEAAPERGGLVITTWPVVTETAHMLDVDARAQLDSCRWVAAGGVVVHEVPQAALGRVIDLVEKYGDLPMDLADATLVVAAEVLGVREIVSIDRDFEVYRIGGRASFENLYPRRWSNESRR